MPALLKRAVVIGMVLLLWLATVRPSAAQDPRHMPHQPRSGGVLLTADQDRLHVEGVWAVQRRFKLLVQDATGDSVSLERLRGMRGRVKTGAQYSDLQLLEADGYFEARVPTVALPGVFEVELQTTATAPLERLSFRFDAYSVDTSGDTTEAPLELPATMAGILAALRVQQVDVTTRARATDLSPLVESEHAIRELVVGMEPHLSELAEPTRRRVEDHRVIALRAVWLLHMAFDYGTTQQMRAAAEALSDALAELLAAAQ